MIAGPIMPHPRFILRGLLEADARHQAGSPRAADVLEAGLVVLEEDLSVDEALHVDFLARDASGAPVLVLAVDRDDAERLLQRIVDLDLWFRDNGFLLERGLAGREPDRLPLHWSEGPRFLVVARDPPSRLYRRLAALSGPQLMVFELRSVTLRGELLWLLQGVAPWVEGARPLETVPAGVADPMQRELVDLLLDRLRSLVPGLEMRGDRFSRRLTLAGRSLLVLQAGEGGVRVTVGSDGASPSCELRSRRDVDTVLDRVMRQLLGMPEKPANASGSVPPFALSPAELAAFLSP